MTGTVFSLLTESADEVDDPESLYGPLTIQGQTFEECVLMKKPVKESKRKEKAEKRKGC